ncbi:MAG: AAA family ATPase [Microbacterium sp.]|uniref:AAA family ATPase n=1 Tax=Microbacterium sp. TaxID=51671 RepID=UPI003F9E3BAA
MSDDIPSPKKAHLTHIKINRFRAIKSADIELGHTTALVGQNGSGKTTVLRALNAFFNYAAEEPDFQSGRHKYTIGSQSVIEVVLEGLADSGLPLSDPAVGQV